MDTELEDTFIKTFNTWRIKKPYRPYKIYHFKLITFLFVQIIEWITDICVAWLLLVNDHMKTGISTAVFTLAPAVVISACIVTSGYPRQTTLPYVLEPFRFVGLGLVTFVKYVVWDVLTTYWAFFGEAVMFVVDSLCTVRKRDGVGWLVRLPDKTAREYIFFKGVYQFWFESVPQTILRFIMLMNGEVLFRPVLWWAIMWSMISALINGVKVFRFKSKTKLRIWVPALLAVKSFTENVKLAKKQASLRANVVCTLGKFPWVDFYNDVYSSMVISEIPADGLDYFRNVCRLASRTWHLRQMQASNCDITDNGPLSVGFLTEAMRHNHGLKFVDLSKNRIGNQGAGCLSELLRHDIELTHLDISHNRIGVEGARFLQGALVVNTMLKNLDISHNKMENEGGVLIGEALKKNGGLEKLVMTECGFQDEAMSAISSALSTNRCLKRLQLSHNAMGIHAAKEIDKSLKRNTVLEELGLERTGINDACVAFICSALHDNSTLTKLDLVKNKVTSEGALEIESALKMNNMLQYLFLGGNSLGPEGTAKICRVLKLKSTMLTSLSVFGNKIGPKGAEEFANALMENSCLAELDIADNGIGVDGAKALAKALKVNKTLKVLDLGSNLIKDDGAQGLLDALSDNESLNKMVLDKRGVGQTMIDEFTKHSEANPHFSAVFEDGLRGPGGVSRTYSRRQGVGGLSISEEYDLPHLPSISLDLGTDLGMETVSREFYVNPM